MATVTAPQRGSNVKRQHIGGDALSQAPALEFTILKCPSHELAVKVIDVDPRQSRAYDFTKIWKFKPMGMAGLAGLKRLLERLAEDQRAMVIRGAPIDGLELDQWQPRRWVGDDATIEPVARNWLSLDCDGIAVPEGLGAGDKLLEAALYIRDNVLPAAFKGVEMVASATASTGRAGASAARLRLWVVTSRRYSDESLRQWATGFKVATGVEIDESVFRAGQPIYTGRPVFMGLSDPVPAHLRVVAVPGDIKKVDMDIKEHDGALVEANIKICSLLNRTGMNWKRMADATVGGDLGFFMPLTTVIGLAAAEDAGVEDVVDYLGRIIWAKADPIRKRAYNDSWLRRSVRRLKARDMRAHGVGGGPLRVLTDADLQWFEENGAAFERA